MTMRVQPVMSSSHSARVAEAMALSNSALRKRYRSSYETSSSSPSLSLPVQRRYRGTSELILDTHSEEDEIGGDDTNEDEGHSLDDEGHGLDDEGYELDGDEEVVPERQQQAASVVEIVVGEPLGLGYRVLRHQELAIEEDQPTLTTWIDPEDGIAYIDIPSYPPPAQTPPLPEWSSGLLFVSLAPSVVPLPISSTMISLTVPLPIASPERTVMTFGALWRPVLALEAWTGHVDIQMEDMSREGYNDHSPVHDMLV
nr:hypothetical protein [Tanacetum cinerariifolium]GEY47179.1 hypothetical protein [Tanacetum cinerariifolium]